MCGRILLIALAGVCFAAPAFAASGFVALSAPRGFAVAHVVHVGPAGRSHRRFFDGAAALDTLATGSFETAPEDAAALPPPPYPPPYYYPAYYAPPHPCFRPLLIHLAPEKHIGKLPRVIYGINPQVCQE